MKNKIEFDEDSFLIVKKKVSEENFVDTDGKLKKRITYREEIPREEISLGSFKEPNKNILSFKYKKKIKWGEVFGGMFQR